MAFNPGETIHGYYLQGKFIDRLLDGLPWADYFHPLSFPLYIGQMCTPHPGTELHHDASNLGLVLTKKWSDYYHHRVNFIPDSLLSDIPIQNLSRLGINDYIVLIAAMNAGLYSSFYQKDLFRSALICCFIMDLATNLLISIDGKTENKSIFSKIASHHYYIDKVLIYAHLSLMILVMSQLGWIKSVRIDNGPIIPKRLFLPYKSKFRYKVGVIAMLYVIFSKLKMLLPGEAQSTDHVCLKTNQTNCNAGLKPIRSISGKLNNILISFALGK
jgi:hypothetical protein